MVQQVFVNHALEKMVHYDLIRSSILTNGEEIFFFVNAIQKLMSIIGEGNMVEAFGNKLGRYKQVVDRAFADSTKVRCFILALEKVNKDSFSEDSFKDYLRASERLSVVNQDLFEFFIGLVRLTNLKDRDYSSQLVLDVTSVYNSLRLKKDPNLKLDSNPEERIARG